MTETQKTTIQPLVRPSRDDIEARVKAAISREIDRNSTISDSNLEQLSQKVLHEVMRALVKAGVDV